MSPGKRRIRPTRPADLKPTSETSPSLRKSSSNQPKPTTRTPSSTREVAEIGVVEYERGVFMEDEISIKGDLRLFESDLSRETDNFEFAKTQLAKFREAPTGTIFNLAREFSVEDGMRDAELRQSKARVAVAKAQSKLDVLRKFTKPKCVKELQIEVEKARWDERDREAKWQQEKLKLAKLEEAVKKQSSASRPGEGMRPLLERAISIAKEIKSKLVLAMKEREPSAAVRNEIIDLTARLQALIAQVPATMAADQWACETERSRGGSPDFILRPQSKTEAK